MTEDSIRVARELFRKVNSERGTLDDVAVAFGNVTATYITLRESVVRMNLSSDPRVEQAEKIKAMADSRDTGATLPEEVIPEYTRACYVLSQVLIDNIPE